MEQTALAVEVKGMKLKNISGKSLHQQVRRHAIIIKSKVGEQLQDGGGVRRGDHLPTHKYIKTTSTCGTTPTEHLLNAGRRPQTSQKARNSPRTWVGQKKKEKTGIKE